MGQILTFAGRQLEVLTDTTISQDSELHKALKMHGLERVEFLKDETNDAFIARIMDQLLEADAWADILAARLGIFGDRWTRSTPAAVREILLTVTDAAEKKWIMDAMPAVILGFFAQGLISLETFRSSSNGAEEDLEETSPTTRSGAGRGWFASLLTLILSVFRRSSTAHSAKLSPATKSE